MIYIFVVLIKISIAYCTYITNKRIPTLSLFENKEIIFSNRKYVRNI